MDTTSIISTSTTAPKHTDDLPITERPVTQVLHAVASDNSDPPKVYSKWVNSNNLVWSQKAVALRSKKRIRKIGLFTKMSINSYLRAGRKQKCGNDVGVL